MGGGKSSCFLTPPVDIPLSGSRSLRFFRFMIVVGFLPFAALLVATGASFAIPSFILRDHFPRIFRSGAASLLFSMPCIVLLSSFPFVARTTEKESKTTHGIENSRPAAPARTTRGKLKNGRARPSMKYTMKLLHSPASIIF
jgi:hypothetical protein